MQAHTDRESISGSAGSLRWTMDFEPEANIVVVRTEGPIDKSSMPKMLQATIEFTRRHRCRRILADHRASELKMDVFETFNSPRELFLDSADWKNRAALVYSVITEEHKFMETVFLNNHRTVALFTDINLARQWLTTGPEPGRKD